IEITGTGSGDLSWTGTASGSLTSTTLPAIATGLGAGTYNFTFNNGCTSNTVSVSLVDPLTPLAPIVTSSGSTTFCNGGSVILSSSSSSGNVWSTGETTQTITVSTSGTYSVLTTQSGCTSASSLNTTVTVNPIPAVPTITVSGPTTFCAGGNVTLTSSSVSNNVWSTGETTQSITVSASGVYFVSEIVNSCSASSTNEIVTSIPLPATPIILANGPLTLCLGENILLTSSYATGNIWSTGETTQSILVSSAGSYNVTVSNGTCSATSSNTVINVDTPPVTPVISSSGVTTFCDGGNVVLTSSSLTGNVWSTGSTSQSITVTSSGNYNVTVSNGVCSAVSLDEVVTVNPVPAVPVIVSNGSTTICQGQSVELSSSSLVNNSWSTGELTQVITVSNPGTYSVTVSQLGCSATSLPLNVIVTQTPATPIIMADGSYTFCQGGSVNLSSTANSNFVWSTGQTAPVINVSSSQVITVTVTINGCSSTSSPLTVTEFSNPIVTLTPINDVCNTSGVFALTNGLPSGGNYTVNGVSTTTFNPATENLGANTIVYTLLDGNGCTGSTSGNINVLNCLSLEEEAQNLFTVYPNPSSGVFYLKSENIESVRSVVLHDALGRIVNVYFDITEATIFDLSEYAEGMYTISIKGDDFENIQKVQLIK
ncbi:MAG: T9SS type A sorting domain-containing protein, partial [Flavobacteriia bacterium]